MAILRVAECSACGKLQQEASYGGGWNGWFGIQGISLNGDGSPMFCEECKTRVMEAVDTVVSQIKAEKQ